MAKIIAIENEQVIIETSANETKSFSKSEISFSPTIGEEVEIIHSDGKDIIRRISNGGQTFTTPTTTTPQHKPVNKLAYCLLALFLGAWGGHKFYAGKPIWGIVYIILSFFGISSIIALVELIIALCKTSDRNGNILV